MKLSKASVDRVVSAFADLKAGDPRRKTRVAETVRKMAANPQATLPEAMGSEAALEGAYRLMNSGHISPQALLTAHARVTALHAKAAAKVVVIHDTTTFQFAHADPAEVGYLNTGKPGFLAHYSLVVARGTRRPLGIGHLEPMLRDNKPAARSPGGAKSRRRTASKTTKNPERESLRWSRGFAATTRLLEGCETVHVADREGDNYELMGNAVNHGQHFVIRVRVKARSVSEAGGRRDSLSTIVGGCCGVLRREVMLSSRAPKPTKDWEKSHPARVARIAALEFSATTIELKRPQYQSKELPPTLALNVVRVFEPSPPHGVEPVEWLLYTTEAIDTPEAVASVVDIYRTRWLIEECNKVLKTGCRYEQHQFESRDALLTLLALTMPIACELLWLRARAREEPTRPARDVLSPLQIQILAALGSRKLPPRPTIHDGLWAIAGLGGHIKNNGEPGWLVLHRGMVKLAAYEEGWSAALSATRRSSRKSP